MTYSNAHAEALGSDWSHECCAAEQPHSLNRRLTDDHTQLMGGLRSAVTALDELPHSRPAGRLLLAAASAGKGAIDDAVASLASMPIAVARDVIPTMLVRCPHVAALLAAKTNGHLLGTTYSGIRVTADGQRRLISMRDHLIGG